MSRLMYTELLIFVPRNKQLLNVGNVLLQLLASSRSHWTLGLTKTRGTNCDPLQTLLKRSLQVSRRGYPGQQKPRTFCQNPQNQSRRNKGEKCTSSGNSTHRKPLWQEPKMVPIDSSRRRGSHTDSKKNLRWLFFLLAQGEPSTKSGNVHFGVQKGTHGRCKNKQTS